MEKTHFHSKNRAIFFWGGGGEIMALFQNFKITDDSSNSFSFIMMD